MYILLSSPNDLYNFNYSNLLHQLLKLKNRLKLFLTQIVKILFGVCLYLFTIRIPRLFNKSLNIDSRSYLTCVALNSTIKTGQIILMRTIELFCSPKVFIHFTYIFFIRQFRNECNLSSVRRNKMEIMNTTIELITSKSEILLFLIHQFEKNEIVTFIQYFKYIVAKNKTCRNQ